uniref:Uncharacterized protein n=1 Tax=Oryza barthii TaxID=65489 RepID=A0A0D3H5E8_9ORYZ
MIAHQDIVALRDLPGRRVRSPRPPPAWASRQCMRRSTPVHRWRTTRWRRRGHQRRGWSAGETCSVMHESQLVLTSATFHGQCSPAAVCWRAAAAAP